MKDKNRGYLFALITILIWGTTFISTKILLVDFEPSEILFLRFLIGFVIAMAGVCCISFNGKELHLNPIGDLLSVGAAFVWACYSVITKKISGWGYSTIQTTKRIFAYGLVFIIPSLFFFKHKMNFYRIIEPLNLLNIVFLGLGASALCFVTWNYAVKVLGAVKTSSFIYMVPVITIIASVIILNEPITRMEVMGTILTLAGLIISEKNIFRRTVYSKKIEA